MYSILIKIKECKEWESEDYFVEAAKLAKTLSSLFCRHTAVVAPIKNFGFIIKIPTMKVDFTKAVGMENVEEISKKVKFIYPNAELNFGEELSPDILIQGFRK